MSGISTPSAAEEFKSLPLSVPRPATGEDLPAVVAMLDTVFSSAGRSAGIGKAFSFVYSPENAANILVVTCGDQVVSALSLWPNEVQLGQARLRVAGINCVATHPDFRRHGLATHLMRAAIKRMAALNCHLGIVSATVPNWYRRNGWELAGRMRTYQFNRGNITMLPKLPDQLYIEGPTETSLDEALAIYSQLNLGAIRTGPAFRRLLASRYVSDVLVARTADHGVAYLLAAGQRVVEWGGPPTVVAGLVRTWFSRLDDNGGPKHAVPGPSATDSVSLVAPPEGHGLIKMLDEMCIPCSINYARMMLPLDPHGILRAFGLRDITVREATGAFTFTSRTQEVTVDRGAMTKLLFGPERVTDFATDLFPLPFWQWPLDCV